MKRQLSIIIIALLSHVHCSVADTNTTAKIEPLIEQLSWDSIHLNCEAMMLTARLSGSPATNLVNIGKPATKALLRALESEEKCVAAHLILTEIWLPSESGSMQSGDYKDKSATNGWSYTYNKIIPLTWIDDSNGRHIKSEAQLEEAHQNVG